MKKIPVILKMVREIERLDQKQMAKKLKVTQGTISKLESGAMLPTLEVWCRFVTVFEISNPLCFKESTIRFHDGAFNIKIPSTWTT